MLRNIVKQLLPKPAQAILRGLPRELIFRLAMRRFFKDPGACSNPNNPLLNALVFGWGNEYWSGLSEYLAACITSALASRGPVLECGSGLSTILVGAIAKNRGYRHWALEDHPHWAAKVQTCLDRYGLDSTVLSMAPLKDYGDYCWYDPPLASMPDQFSLVVCDGPPSATKGGRYGLAPIMKERLGQGCVLLLDDIAREHEAAIAKRWQVELDSSCSVQGVSKPFAKLVIAKPAQPHQDSTPRGSDVLQPVDHLLT